MMDKILVVIFGAALIAAIAWWFYGQKNLTATDADQAGDVQTATIIVDGGYKPQLISLKVGKPTELTFIRKDPSSCLEEVIMPDFNINERLPVNKPFKVTIQPDAKGSFTYTCGMRMFSGTIEVV
jgi:plastocyanin domain-containing protein